MLTTFSDGSCSVDLDLLASVALRWTQVLKDQSLEDLPYKIETDRLGQVIMSPASADHSEFQSTVMLLLDPMKPNGKVYCECPIATPEGVKVPDVAWISATRRALRKPDQATFLIAPELCIEVISPSNSVAELEEKRTLYFQQGAEEVWTCDLTGKIMFFTSDGEIEHSRLFPKFPKELT